MKKITLILICLIIINSKISAETFKLGEITVYGKSRGINPFYKTVNLEDIKMLNADNAGSALRYEPGIIFKTGRTKREEYISIRGMSQQHIQVYLDGMPVNIPYEGLIDMSAITSNDISSVNFSSISPIEYGARNLGGSVNIISRQPANKYEGSLEIAVSNQKEKKFELHFGQKLKKTYYQFSIFNKKQDSYKISKKLSIPEVNYYDDNERGNSESEKRSYSLKTGWKLNDNFELALNNRFFNHSWEVPKHLVLKISKGMDVLRDWKFTKWERMNNSLYVNYNKDEYNIKIQIFRDKYDNVLNGTNNAFKNGVFKKAQSFISTYDDLQDGINLSLRKKENSGKFNFNINYREDIHKEQSNTAEPWSESRAKTYSFILSRDYKVTDYIFLSGSLSYDLFDKIKAEDQNGLDINPGKDISKLSPALNFIIDDDNFSWYVSAARKINFPTLKNLYSRGIDGSAAGDPNLETETSNNYETGFNIKKNKHRFGLDYFYYDFKNLIIFSNLTGNYYQLDNGYISGIETTYLYLISVYLNADFSYTYLKTKHDNSLLPSDRIHYRPAHDLKFKLSYNKDKWSAGLLSRFAGSQICYVFKSDGTSKEGRLEDYFTADFHIERKINDNFKTELFLENIFDAGYDELYLYPGKSREITLSVTAEL